MHADNLEVLRKEAVRLIQLESSLLSKVSDTPGLVSVAGSSDQQTLDSGIIQQSLEMLEGEKTKLEAMDMVVAVVGTMKAGKSTTINAIVGAEVLPNRNAPMTAIPTLIRHTPGMKEPKLLFRNNAPINNLCESINKALSHTPGLTDQIVQEAPELEGALAFVTRGASVSEEYSGQSGIFEFLKSINDLVRICRVLELEFPFSDYDEMHELPVIEVEFAALSDKEAALGRLTLLDTPGPNEAGQKHLKVMLRDQLRKASAVIAVLNYNQLKSQGDQDLQDEINAVTTLAKGRVYAFVNRFDEKRRNDPDEDSIKTMVNRRFDNDIPVESIFAVSAYRAFISELAQKSLEEHGHLPDPDQPENAWVEEFGQTCLGMDWEDKLDDIDTVSRAAAFFWEKSGFGVPLERVIHTAHQNAAYYALDSTASKLVNLSERLSNFINSRDTALSKTAAELQKHIDSLRGDAQRITALREEKEKEAEDLLGDLRGRVSDALAKTKKQGQAITRSLFEKGVIAQVAREKEVMSLTKAERERLGIDTVSDEKKRSVVSLGDLMAGKRTLAAGGENSKEQVVDPNERDLEFTSADDAKSFLTKIEQALEVPISDLSEQLREALSSTFQHFNGQLESEIARKSGEILNAVSKRLGEDGFNISLKVPSTINSSAFELSSLDMSDGIKKDKKSVTRLRRQSSAGAGVKRFFGNIFGTDWGYDEYQEKINVFRVSLDELSTITDRLLEQQENSWHDVVREDVEVPINTSLEDFFGELEKKVEGLRGDLLQGVADKEKSKNEQDELLKALKSMIRDLPALQEDSEALHTDAHGRLKDRIH
ncbi:dynamin family protein [Marinobacter sp. bablab_jr008]|uniref:dynamin family protein n=1 Tax=Marinobacter sp. bablab_jr008 TaxID=2755064 RepID=UPI0018F16A31|nr:dynamin family protein [Marinobacter sp. bablab_jr008]MEC9386067.1 dynamin family protein [Pseudomonadota bacterium]